jgi:hypothetical protein
MEYLMGGIIIIGIGTLIYMQSASKKSVDPAELKSLKTDLEKKTEEMGNLRSQIEKERSEKNELAGNGKQLFSRFKDLEAEYKSVQHERDDLRKRVSEYEAVAETRERDLDERLQKLHRAEKSLEQERERVTQEDKNRLEKALEERDRMWGEHELDVQALLVDLCKKPETSFTSYHNTNLPEEFDGSLKPDFMIEFLGQYIIFDAKVTRSQDIGLYIKDQVRKTAKKAKGRSDIYSSIFLVVPTDAIGELKELSYYEGGFTFYVVSPEALPSILASFKKITSYDLAEQFDPQERENIVSLIAKLDYHISERNAFDILMARKGSEVLKNAEQLHPELLEEVDQKKSKMGLPNFKKTEIKKLINDVSAREEATENLTSPKAAINI